MSHGTNRREILKLMGVGGVVFASGLAGAAQKQKKDGATGGGGDGARDFFFLQLSDTHWGYRGVSNPEAEVTLGKAVETINASRVQPDFIVFTGDLTHDTDDDAVRRQRMASFKQIVSRLKVKTLRFIPGEHDAAKDGGRAYRELFGPTHYSFDHRGVHFIALDNVSDPASVVGAEQRDWLAADLRKVGRATPVVVFAHRPLFDLYPQWDWDTKDGAAVIDVLLPHPNVTVFYGHIHQENHHRTEHITHHSARSLIFPLPAPGSVPKKAPLPWDASKPFAGLGYRRVDTAAGPGAAEPRLSELAIG